MAFVAHSRLVNPRLGTYYGIFAAMLASLFLLLLILEMLGASTRLLRAGMLVVPTALFIMIGALSWTSDPAEFFASGRRVPAVFNGLLLGATALGATGMVALTGVLFFIGFDALCISIGAIAGFVVMATTLAPYLRKVGAYTLASYLGRRLGSRTVRLTAAAVMALPLLLMLAAELRLAALATGWLTGRNPQLMLVLVVAALLACVLLGGMRSLTWSGVAQVILAVLALAVPVAIVGVFETNMPVPQLSHGPTLRAIGRLEVEQAMPVILAAPIGVELPGPGLSAVSKRFASAFGSIGTIGFTLMTLTVMAGVAAAPWLLPRVGTAPTVYDARKSIGWAALSFGLVMMTLAAVAVFMRDVVMDLAISDTVAKSPYWLRRLVDYGWLQLPATGARPNVSSVLVERDAVLFALPVAAGLPSVLLHLALTGAVAAALAAAASSAVALGSIIAEDVVNGLTWEPPASGARLMLARAAIVAATLAGGAVALIAPADPLNLLLWALALSASTGFPVLLLSIWWKRLNAWGAVIGMTTGFGVAVLGILAAEAGVVEVHSALAAVAAVPCGFLSAIVSARLSPQPDRPLLEMTRDLRIPGGETIFDREARLIRLRQRQRV